MRRGTRVANAHVGVTVDGDGINEDIVDEVEKAEPGVEKAGRHAGDRYRNGFSVGFFSRMRQRFGKQIEGELSKHMDTAGKHGGEAMGSAMVQSLRERLRGADDLVTELGTNFDKALAGRTTIAKLEIMSQRLKTAEGQARRLTTELHKAMEAEGLINVRRVSGNAGTGGGRGGGDGGLDADMIGRLFGGHSRNNFLNIFGRSIAGITKGLTAIPTLLSKVASSGLAFFTNFSKGFSQVAEGASLFRKIMGGFSGAGGGLFASLAKSGPAAAFAIVAVTLALSVMASVMSALLAIVIAMAATIAGALTAALIGLSGLLGTTAIAGGLLTAAFMSMTDAQKKYLEDAFRPLKAEMVGIGQIMLQEMVPAFSTWSANLQNALMLLVPVAQVAGRAFAEAGNTLTKSFSGPGFQMFSQALATYLPSIITRLSSALGSFLNGMLGLFSALMPYVNRFAGYLAVVAERFAKWATSAEGQNAIVQFVDRAVESLKSLWNFTTAFFGFLFELLFSSEAMNSGNSIFDSMARTFDNFTQKVQQAQADGSLQRWFHEATVFGAQLWGVMEALGGTFQALSDSGTLKSTGDMFGWIASMIGMLNGVLGPLINVLGNVLPWTLRAALTPLAALASGVIAIGEAVKWVLNLVGIAQNVDFSKALAPFDALYGGGGGGTSTGYQPIAGGQTFYEKPKPFKMPTLPSLQQSGMAALNATSIDSGGYKPKKQWQNPWKKWANSLIKDGPSTAVSVKEAMRKLNKAAGDAIRAAAKENGGETVFREAFTQMTDSLVAGGRDAVTSARSALNSAASSLANATTKGAAQRALKKVRKAQRDMSTALAYQKSLNRSAKALASQKVVHWDKVSDMVAGKAWKGATLADLAAARFRVAAKLEVANQKLVDAIALRDDYKAQVADSIKSFAALATTQAQTIDGVEQALTSGDITANLQARLDKIKHFQSALQLLIANGLSNDAYKQIVDEGVEGGTVLADALLAGGSAAIQQTNSLVSQINGIATTLGTETSNRLYQAGVSAAKGLVDGLTSLSAELDSAATKLGNSIAAAVKRSLGIKSPSSVLRDMMAYVGDGTVLGLQDQHVKVGSAASALADLIAVNPGGGRPPAGGPVSGNGDQRPIELTVVTPTEDPVAVAHEAINELVGRL
jgi:hypothetical protein